MEDVAQRSGVSLKSVSRVINDELGASQETRNRVRHAVQELGYHRNHTAHVLRRRDHRSACLGVVLDDVGNPFAATLNSGVEEVARAHGNLVLAASTGNHGAAVAYAGRLLNVPVTIFLPEGANPVKTRRILDLGARIVAIGNDLSAAIEAAYAEAERTGAFFLHDATDPDIPAGTATIGTEIVTQLPSTDVIFVPMGDTALIRGVASAAKHLKPSIRIVGVAAANAPAYYLSWRGGAAVSTDTANTIADGLAVRRALAANVAAISALLDDVRIVEEDELLAAMAHLMTREGVTAEPAAAAATAALMKDREAAGTIVLLVTGSNVAPDVLERVAGLANR
jgi:threonine dehydratase